GWQGRVDGLIPKVTATLGDLKKVMGDAGYADGSYDLVLMSYSSPITPDFRDNPKFPGKLPGGCVGYDADARWGRDTAVPAFQKGLRPAPRQAGATYLDGSRLF
ncbi:Ricin B lectin, partial [Streptomyces sp. NRRL WC-3753]